MELIRKNIQQVKAYVSGKPIEETKRELGLRSVIKLASNENPIGASPKAVAAMRKAVTQVNRYPDSQSFYLKARLAAKLKLQTSNLVLGNGSDELIDIVIKTFVEDDENIVTAEQTFVEYEIISRVNNKKCVAVPLKDFTFDLDAILAAVNKKTKLIFIANPNNPTGTYVGRAAFERFIKKLPSRTVVVLDEAYDTFIDVKDYPQGIDYIKSGKVIVLKTMSKGYGLAGLRIGYCIADSRYAAYMERTRQPFNVNLVAQAGALAALDDDAFLAKTRMITLAGKKYFYSQLSAMGIRYIPSVTNFVLIDVQSDCVDIFKKLLKQSVIVRD
ncbi:MAG: histidinol-phosphate transaminase, partial [Candidatus Omnitrophota bacterium]